MTLPRLVPIQASRGPNWLHATSTITTPSPLWPPINADLEVVCYPLRVRLLPDVTATQGGFVCLRAMAPFLILKIHR